MLILCIELYRDLLYIAPPSGLRVPQCRKRSVGHIGCGFQKPQVYSGSSGPSGAKQPSKTGCVRTLMIRSARSRGEQMKKSQVFSIAALMFMISMSFTTTTLTEAQVLYGSVVGTVTDESGAVVAGAAVRLTNEGTSQTRETATNDTGAYNFPDLTSGTYDITVTKAGFKTSTTRGIVVSVDKVVRVNPGLHVGDVSQAIDVTTETPALQTDSAQVRAEVTPESLVNAPIPVNRNYQNLLITVPGFMPPANQHSAAVNPSRGLTASVNGTTRNSNNLR